MLGTSQHLTAQPRQAADAASKLFAFPVVYTKTVYLVRHGQAWSNVAGEKDHAQYSSEEWFDASLSDLGWQQAEALGRHVRAIGLRPQLVVVSPLTRALQTAAAAFGDVSKTDAKSAPPLMVAFEAEPGHQVAHDPISSVGAPPFLVHELAREHMGVHPCDRRRPTAEVQAKFPGADFSLVTDATDQLWKPDEREAKEAIRERAATFLAWLMTRPEREIAVVSHSSFLHYALSNFSHHAGLPEGVVSEYTRWFENCELRSFTLTDASLPNPPKSVTNFPGGLKAVAAAPPNGNGHA